MSTTIDQRVVEMRFDNRQFESNVQTSMSTIDKLKKSLHLDGASKGLENVSAAAKKCDMTPIGNAVEIVKVKFSAFEVMAVTALANITNSAVNAGKNIVSALTIDPVKTGFQEYETQINAVQTILSNTRSKGTTLDQVNSALDELNHYADMTIYNFTEMTRNIGTFTAAGVDLDTSVSAIKGIANLAAVSGSNSQQASTAMYQLSQALAAGTVKLQDWNSVVNAGMGGQVFQDALTESARVHGIAIDQMIKDEGSFRETLKNGWLSSEILTETLSKFTGDLTEAQIISMGYTKEQAAEIIAMGQDANDAATKVKTFSQLWDTLKEAAQSGWTQSWELIVGDFEQAKERLTGLSDTFSKIIGDAADRRNAVLTGAFSSNFNIFNDKLKAAGISTETFQNKVKALAKSHNVDLDEMIKEEGSFEKALKKAFNDGTLDKSILKDALKGLLGDLTGTTKSTEEMATQVQEYGQIVDDVINGKFGNGEARMKALTDAGYDYATVQNLVNEKLGSTVRHLSSLNEEQIKNADSLAELSDEQLINTGYTEEQIEAIRDLQKQAETAGSSIDELIEAIDKPSGAELLWEALFNVIQSTSDALAAVKKAWNDTFHAGMTEDEILEEKANKLYNLIKAVNEFTQKLQLNHIVADKIVRTFKGLFAIIDIIATVTGGGLKLAFTALSTVLGAFDMDILDVTANMGDMLVQFRDFLFHNERFNEILRSVAEGLVNACKQIKSWIDAFLALPEVQNAITEFNTEATTVFENLKTHFSDGVTRIQEFIERVKAMDGLTVENLNAAIKDFKDNVIDYFFDLDGAFEKITTAATDFKDKVESSFTDAGQSVDTLQGKLYSFITFIKTKLSEHIGLGEVLTVGVGAGLILSVKKIGNILEVLSKPLVSLQGILDGVGGVLESVSALNNAKAWEKKSKAVLNIAIAVGILAAALVALTTQTDTTKLGAAIGAIFTLSVGLVGLYGIVLVMDKVAKTGGGLKGAAIIIAMAASLKILAGTLKSMEDLSGDNLLRNIVILGLLVASLGTVAALLGKFAPSLSTGGLTLLAISAALKVMVGALRDLDALEFTNLDQDIMLLRNALLGLVVVSTASRGISLGSGVAILAMVVALKVFVGVFDDIANLDMDKIQSNIGALIVVFGLFGGLVIASKFAGANAAKAGAGILAMSASLILMAAAIKILSGINAYDLQKAEATVRDLLLVFMGVVVASNFAGEHAAKAGAMLLLMSGALLILSAVIVILSHIDPSGLARSLVAITILETLFAGLIAVSYLAKECKSTLTLIAVTIGILAVALGTLSMINPESLASATKALSTVMAMFALVVASTSLAKEAKGTLIVITGAITILSGVLYLLAGLPVDSVLGSAEALSLLLLSLSASMLILSNCKSISSNAYTSAGIMVLIVGALGGILGLMASMDVGPTLELAESLSVLLLSLSGACLILSKIKTTGSMAAIGVAMLVGLIATIGALMVAIGALAEYNPGLEEFLQHGMVLLEAIGNGLGSFFGGIVNGFAVSATAGLPQIGENLSEFMDTAQTFFDGAKALDTSVVNGTKNLAETILILTAADVANALAKRLFGASSVSDFAEQLVPFGKAMNSFAEEVKGLESGDVERAAIAGKAIAEMAAALPNSGGVLGFIVGENDMDRLKDQLPPFGKAIMGFAKEVDGLKAETVTNAATAGKAIAEMAASIPNSGGALSRFVGDNDMTKFGEHLVELGTSIMSFSKTVDGLSVEVVTNATTAGKALTEMARTVPNCGGLISFLTGDNDLVRFGSQLVTFGSAIKQYSVRVTGLNADVVTNSTTAGKALVELANTVPNSGGLFSLWTGDNNLSMFGLQLVAFGAAMKLYSIEVSGIDTEAVNNSAIAGKALVELANTVPKTSGLLGFFVTGSSDLAVFGSQLVLFGSNIATYSKTVTDVDPEVVNKSALAASVLVGLQNSLPKNGGLFSDKMSLADIGLDIARFGMQFRSYYASISEIDIPTLSGVITQTNNLVTMAKGMSNLDTSGMSGFSTALVKLGNAGIDGFIKAFDNSKTRVTTSMSTMITTAISAVNSQTTRFTNTFVALMQAALTAINSKQSSFNTVGTGLMTNFISGITSQSSNSQNGFIAIIDRSLAAINGKQASFQTAGDLLMVKFITGVKAENSNVTTTFVDMIKSCMKSITDQYAEFQNAGRECMTKLASGMQLKDSDVKTALISGISKAISGARTYYKQFYKTGVYLVEGFIKGMDDSISKAAAKSQEMAKAAVDAAKEELDENSPSKVFEEIGEYAGQGFVDGLDNYVEEADEAGGVIGYAAMTSIASSVKDGGEEVTAAITENNQETTAETKNFWTNLISTVTAYSAEKTAVENSGVEATKTAAKKTAEVHEEQIAEEDQYWAKLLETKRKGEEADKYQSMQMVDFKKEILNSTVEILKTYTDEVQSTTESLMNSSSMFEDAEKASDLTKNLKEQISELEEYKRTIEELNARITDGGLKDALSQMGVESLDELKLINSMTDAELTDYSNLYDQKYALCQQLAVTQLQGLQTETESKLSELYGGAQVNLEQFSQSFNGTFESIRSYVGESIKIGSELASGVAQGISEGTDQSKTAATEMIKETEAAAKEAADIHSPSGLFRDEVGKNITAGIAEGMSSPESLSLVKESAAELNAAILESFTESNEQFLTAGEEIINACNTGMNSSSDSFTSQCTETIRTALTAMQTSINNSQTSFQTAASGIMSSFVAGVKSKEIESKSLITNVLSGCLTAINNKQTQFHTAGSTLMIKLIGGIKSKDAETQNAIFVIVKACLKKIEDKYSDFRHAGTEVVGNFASGIKSSESKAEKEFTDLLSATINTIRGRYKDFSDAGDYLVRGFAAGIDDATFRAEAAARAMARAAIDAAEEELDEHSPSKEGKRIGDYFGLGFVNGIAEYADKAYGVSSDMAGKAKSGLTNAISEIQTMLESGIDTEPTIRPVLDLSDVESKSLRLNSLFSSSMAVRVSNGMNAYRSGNIQNDETTRSSGNSFVFTQNNYSPKALSRSDIYRQTKNQFSAMERMVEV